MENTPSGGPVSHTLRPVGRRQKLIGTAVVVIGLLLLAALAWYLVHRGSSSSATGFGGGRRMPASTVGVATVKTADIPVDLEALGTVTSPATVTVIPQVSGVIDKIAFTEGQLVKKGELLAQIDPRPFQATLDQAKGTLANAQAQLAVAQKQYERYQTLISQDSIAQQDVDTQAATVKQLQGTVAADKAAVESAALDLTYSRITAPVAGRVGLRVVDPGNYIAAGSSTGIVVITQVKPIDVEFSVPQDQVADVLAHSHDAKLPAVALDRTRTKTLASGTFLTLDNQVDTTTGTVKAKARFANDDEALFPSQFVNLRLQLDTIKDAIVVPQTAVRNGADGDFVYIVNDDHTVSVRKVTRGQQTDDAIQITKGLKVGEQVVTEGGDRLKDGASVQLPAEAAEKKATEEKAASERKPKRRHRPGSAGPGGPGGPPPGP
ncbi:MdtA/MuxA family multidrug efflux RND transporter periplasmic adaptor subunit [Solimonas marina]|uniref:MdtA/MuxA family multidrug efflux RND transporter periplasmic adaptor subunit n=1 Tax=Solimonas marina TaxID=2714601 RepID=A0A969WDA3_9GAMM|nr:MdtA/MuxA family multidrug efflux RND transporter periplasmic adaptor subunit [Solimonas marina]NKF23898.1 MdtA/MuxA family multidrug efflux RND transporter periplasmic adaptor subunit [Solimonas marina]